MVVECMSLGFQNGTSLVGSVDLCKTSSYLSLRRSYHIVFIRTTATLQNSLERHGGCH
jgi:hypothetical protein